MSTRVQKGSTVFKPVARPRSSQPPSSASRQTSAIPDSQPSVASGGTAHHGHISIPPREVASMPPPPSISHRRPSALPQPIQESRRPPPIASSSSHNQENTIPASCRPHAIQTPSRDGHRPPAIRPSTPPRELSPLPLQRLTEQKKVRKKRSGGSTVVEDEGSASAPKRRRRASSSSSVPRRSRTRQPSVPPFDPSANPGEELDPTVVTMAALCDDTGQGRVSTKAAQIVSNHAAWRAANREKRTRIRAQMEARKYGRDADEDQPAAKRQPEDASQSDSNEAGPSSQPVPGPSAFAPEPAVSQDPSTATDDFDYGARMATSRYAVQVRIGPNGETIIDEDSLFVDRAEELDTAEYTHVEESDTTKFVNSATYGRKLRGSRWSAEETELFYDALSQFGENYELISYVLPGRDRKQCKNKFKIEDKKNPARITYCLNNRRPYDIQTLSRLTGKDFSGPTPVITAPVRLRLDEPEQNTDRDATQASQSTDTVQNAPTRDEEILGNIEDDEDLPDSLFVK